MPTVRGKALKYYRDQDLRIVHAHTPDGAHRPNLVEARVRGFRDTYTVTLRVGVWSCTCDAAKRDCAHRAAVQMATGHKSAAAKEPR